MAGDMARFNDYHPQNSAELYPAMGDCDDYHYGDLKVLSFTFEICSTFIPSPSQIDKFTSVNIPAVIYLIEKSGTYGVVTPSGDEEIIANLDFDTGVKAIADVVDLFDGEADIATRNEVLNRIEKISLRVAELVVEDLNNASKDSWQTIKEMPQAKLAASFVRNRVLFNQAHGQEYTQDIIAEFRK
jgi:hypothetical protein